MGKTKEEKLHCKKHMLILKHLFSMHFLFFSMHLEKKVEVTDTHIYNEREKNAYVSEIDGNRDEMR